MSEQLVLWSVNLESIINSRKSPIKWGAKYNHNGFTVYTQELQSPDIIYNHFVVDHGKGWILKIICMYVFNVFIID